MTSQEVMKLRLGDDIFVYDDGLRDVYKAKIVAMVATTVNKGKINIINVRVDAHSKLLGIRSYTTHSRIHKTEADALAIQSAHLQAEADRILNKKFEIDRKIERL